MGHHQFKQREDFGGAHGLMVLPKKAAIVQTAGELVPDVSTACDGSIIACFTAIERCKIISQP
jgi:hypothetical protein